MPRNLMAQMLLEQEQPGTPSLDDMIDGAPAGFPTAEGDEWRAIQAVQAMSARSHLAQALAGYKGMQNMPLFNDVPQPQTSIPFAQSVNGLRPSTNIEDNRTGRPGWFGGPLWGGT